ncbi:MAG: isoleucine--tRNA ligase [Candidatus Woesearchaeota archaeon]
MYVPNELEKEVLNFWQTHDIFNKLRNRNKGKKKYSFIDGPITANNPMGVHHAWGRTYKDVYQRFKALQGFDQRYQNGFDCQGLWVEVEVEKDLGFDSKKDIENFGLDKFSEACKERIEKYSGIQASQSIRLGQWMDWDNSYYTHTDNNIEHIWHFLKKCLDNKWLYKGHRVMPWCIRCGTSLSQHELVDSYKDMEHTSVFLQFKLKHKKDDEYLLVWTTTPWTLSSNVACAVNPDLSYVEVSKQGKIYYLSEKTLPKLGGEYIVLDHHSGKDLLGWEYESPYPEIPAQKKVVHKVVPWGVVGEDEGTGIVHIAPGCGAEDNQLGKELKLDTIAPIDEAGNYLEGFGWQTGKNIKDMLNPILDDLKKKGILYKQDQYKHRYPVCWRCGDELAFRLVDEWFIASEELRPRLIKAAKEVEWVPDYGGKLMEDWLNNMGDWCISRKRFWGLPLPIWRCKNGHEHFIESKKELEEKAVSGLPLQELHRPWIDAVKIKCDKCKELMTRIPDVGDCWLDAGIVPFSTLNYLNDREYWEQWYPAELVIEMREQIRLWFYSLLFMSVTLQDKAPYKRVFAYEKVHDETGRPMHKSWGNAIWFDEAVEKMGADVMRWMYMSHRPHQNLNFGYKGANDTKQLLSTVFNIREYLKDYIVNNDFKGINLTEPEDRWIMSRLNNLKKKITLNLEELKPNVATNLIEEFFLEDLSRTYIQFIRDRINEKKNKEVVYILYNCLFEVLKLMSPIAPFMTEKIYQESFRLYENKESIHLFFWPAFDQAAIDEKLETEMDIVKNAIQAILGAREKAQLGIRWPIKEVVVECDENAGVAIKSLQKMIKSQTNIKILQINSNIPEMKIEILPNHKMLGPKFGNMTPKIIGYLAESNCDKILAEMKKIGKHDVKIGKDTFELREEDVVIKKEVPEPYIIGEFKYGHVYLNTERDAELDEEGYVRELTRRIQTGRKNAELVKADRIKLYIKTEMADDLEKWKEHILNKVGAEVLEISKEDSAGAFDHSFEEKIKDREFYVRLSKV